MSDQFRLATVKDAEKLLELIKRAYQTIRELEIEFTAVHADMEMILENLSEHTCFVLEREGRLLATISLRSLVEVTEYPFLYWFAVDPDCKNQGIGSRLLRYVEETVVRDTLHAPCATLATSRSTHGCCRCTKETAISRFMSGIWVMMTSLCFCKNGSFTARLPQAKRTMRRCPFDDYSRRSAQRSSGIP